MSASSVEIQTQVGSLSRWAQHIEEPFSPASLGSPDKPYAVVGSFEFPDAMCRFDEVGQDWSVADPFAKYTNDLELGLTCRSNICTQRTQTGDCNELDLTGPLHLDFQDVAHYILGETVYTESSVDLTLWRRPVPAGTGQEPSWHLDIEKESDGKCLMGLVSDELLTQILLNPTCPDDYEDGHLKRIMGAPIEMAILRIRTLPSNKLVVLPMSIPHRGQIATIDLPQRHFMRWWVES